MNLTEKLIYEVLASATACVEGFSATIEEMIKELDQNEKNDNN